MNKSRGQTTDASPPMTPDEERLGFDDYRPLSNQAIACLLLGVLSSLAMTHVMLWLVPVGAVVFAALTLRRLRRHAVSMRGHGLARAGLVLAILFLAIPVSHAWMEQRLLVSQAEKLSTAWLEKIIAGHRHEAYVWTLHPQLRPPADADLPAYFGEPSRIQDINDFFAREPVTEFSGTTTAVPRFKEYVGWGGTSDDRYLTLIYEIHFPDSNHVPLIVRVLARRAIDPKSHEVTWQMSAVNSLE